MKARRVTLVISSLGCGGAERVVSTISDYWTSRDVQVAIITLDSAKNDFYRLNNQVERTALDLLAPTDSIFGSIVWNLRRIKRIRQAIARTRPDVVVSFMDTTSILVILATRFTRYPVVVSERTDPTQRKIGNIWKKARSVLYPRAQMLVMQTNAVKPWAQTIMGHGLVKVIPNPVLQINGIGQASVKWRGHAAVAMGRLIWHKGFDLLIKAFAECCRSCEDWTLIILGEGEERSNLESQVDKLGIGDRVLLPGKLDDAAAVLRQADIFVMPSFFEGFPNALCEAMACGLPAVSFDCPSGPAEIIRDGVDGILVPLKDTNALSQAMLRLMKNEQERTAMSGKAREIVERYSLENVMAAWEDAIDEAIAIRES